MGMKVTVFDEDLLSADDLLGAASDLIAERFIGRHAPVDETLPLKFEGEPAGDLTISTRWFHLTRDVPVTGISQAVAHGPSQLVLRARFDSAHDLPSSSGRPFTVRVSVTTKDKASVTDVAHNDVENIIEEAMRPTASADHMKSENAKNPDWGEIIRLLLPWTPEMRDKAVVSVEILDCKHRRVGQEFRKKVEEIAREPVKGPMMLKAAQLNCRLD